MYKHNFTFRCLILLLFISANLPAIAQVLHIGKGVTWHSHPWIVLNDMDLIYNGAPSLPHNKMFNFTGTTNSVIRGDSLPDLGVLRVSKKGTAKIILHQNITVGSQVQFESGFIDLNNRMVSLETDAFILFEQEHTRFIGNNGGFISINYLINGTATVNPGNLGAIITPSVSQEMGFVLIRRGHQVQSDERVPRNTSIQRFYDIHPSINTNLNATLRFHYFDTELAGKNENNLEFFRSINPNNTRWNLEGFTSRNTVTNYVEKTGINSFSRWTLGDPGGTSPRITSITTPGNSRLPTSSGNEGFIMKVYPSLLTTSSIYIQTGNAEIKKMTVKIVDIQGQVVLNRELPYQPQWLYLPPLSGGTYSLQILSDKWKYSTRFVK